MKTKKYPKGHGQKKKKGAIAASQILILIVGLFAFSFMVGSVNADSGLKIVTPTFNIPKPVLAEYTPTFGIQTAGSPSGEIVAGTVEKSSSFLGTSLYSTLVVAAIGFGIGFTLGIITGKSGSESLEYGAIVGGSAGAGTAAFYAGQYLAGTSVGASIAGVGWAGAALMTALPFLAAGAAAIAVFSYLKKSFLKEDQREGIFTCQPWQAERGGDNCEECNYQEFPCTLYECKSLGAGCDIVNPNSDEAACIWTNSRDISSPEISAWQEALEDGYRYEPIPTVRGVEIKYGAETCLPAFTPFNFGIELNKRGYCKMADVRTPSYADMQMNFGGNTLAILTQDQSMSFPGVANLEAEGINVYNGGNFEFYVRCESVNGNANREEFLFKFCIDDGPDTTDPIIRRFSPPDNTFINFFGENESNEIPLQVHVNEPAECKWSHDDKDYEEMEYNLTCSTDVLNFNAELNYPCTGTLTGFENRVENKYYFKCKDNFENTNRESKVLTLTGTEELVISEVSPNNTLIKGSSDSIKVTLEATTNAGANNGAAVCGYSTTGNYNDYALFLNTETHSHTTDVWLGEGSYNYYIQCFDEGGNVAEEAITFDVEKDTSGVTVVRAFKKSNNLRIITDEEATCVYDTVESCLYNFEDGLAMTSHDNLNHFVDWDSDTTYSIKCEDEFGNRPAPNTCSIEVQPFEL